MSMSSAAGFQETGCVLMFPFMFMSAQASVSRKDLRRTSSRFYYSSFIIFHQGQWQTVHTESLSASGHPGNDTKNSIRRDSRQARCGAQGPIVTDRLKEISGVHRVVPSAESSKPGGKVALSLHSDGRNNSTHGTVGVGKKMTRKGSGTMRRCGLVGMGMLVGMFLLEEVCHCGGGL
ncbi:uncharacterized protein LOC119825699 isoform X2 [Arvicola amphibius]|nr:uncharacterized protein LOC119825699 isoform X2 [Arvicola amphibius]XP_041911863.1 uncharacterized protein LOC119825699 isoform X2 [Arvicola amphibius]